MLSQKTELEGECKQVISPHWSCTKNMHEFRNVLLKMVAKAKALQGIDSLHSYKQIFCVPYKPLDQASNLPHKFIPPIHNPMIGLLTGDN
jgi:hypothetical protein